MFDSHCHLHDSSVLADADAQIARARAAGIDGFLLAGVDPQGWQVEADLAARHEQVWMAYGIHPQAAAEWDELTAHAALDVLARELEHRPQALVAIGEIGLDRHTAERKRAWPLQVEVFRRQLDLARQHDLPVVLHILDAQGPALSILEQDGVPRAGGVVHSYSGASELLPRYLALGLHVSFAGAINGERAKRAHAAVQAVPAERLLVETDAPFQTPAPYRPGPNEPAYLPAVVQQMARLRGEDEALVRTYTARNARRLLRLD